MPHEIVLSRKVNAPRERAFTVASDIANAASFIDGITKVEMLTPGPVGEGTRWLETRRIMGKDATVELAITGFRAPDTMTVACESGGASYETRFDFRAEGPDASAIDLTMGVRAKGLLASMMAGLLRGPMAKAMAHDMECIARRAEQRP